MARPGFIFPFATMCGFMLHFAIMFTLIGTDVAIAHQHHKGHIGHILPDTPTNSCTIAWFSPTANPTAVTPSRPNNLSLWSLRTAVADDLDTEDMDENELELYRIDKIKSAIQSAECIADDWPELDLQWCLADWHDGKLVPESRNSVGETCWRCDRYGWSMDPTVSQALEVQVVLFGYTLPVWHFQKQRVHFLMIFSPALIQIAYQSVIRSSIQIKDYAMRYRLTRTVIHTVIQIGIQIKDYLRRYGIYIKGYVTRCRKSKQEGGKRKPKNDV